MKSNIFSKYLLKDINFNKSDKINQRMFLTNEAGEIIIFINEIIINNI